MLVLTLWFLKFPIVSPRMNIITSHDQFKPTRLGENLVVNVNVLQCTESSNTCFWVWVATAIGNNFLWLSRVFERSFSFDQTTGYFPGDVSFSGLKELVLLSNSSLLKGKEKQLLLQNRQKRSYIINSPDGKRLWRCLTWEAQSRPSRQGNPRAV